MVYSRQSNYKSFSIDCGRCFGFVCLQVSPSKLFIIIISKFCKEFFYKFIPRWCYNKVPYDWVAHKQLFDYYLQWNIIKGQTCIRQNNISFGICKFSSSGGIVVSRRSVISLGMKILVVWQRDINVVYNLQTCSCLWF